MIFDDKQRAAEIFDRRKEGETFQAIGASYGISRSRCKSVYDKICYFKNTTPYKGMSDSEFSNDLRLGMPTWVAHLRALVAVEERKFSQAAKALDLAGAEYAKSRMGEGRSAFERAECEFERAKQSLNFALHKLGQERK